MRFMLVIALALSLVACSDADGDTSSRLDAGPAVPEATVVQVAYEDYWVQLVDALDPPDPRHRGLLRRVAGRERLAAKQLIALRGSAGELVRGAYEHDIAMGDHDAVHAKLTDCLTPRTEVFAATSGERIRKDVQGPYPVIVSLESKNGTWKVIEITRSAHACPRPPTSDEMRPQDEESSK